MKALASRLVKVHLDWAPNAFITNCTQVEIVGSQSLWLGIKVLLLWHMLRGWLHHFVAKIKDHVICAIVSKGLGNIMYTNCPFNNQIGPWPFTFISKFLVVLNFKEHVENNGLI